MGNLIPTNECNELRTENLEYEFSQFGIKANIPYAYIAWACAFIPMIIISIIISCILGKISSNYCCVPLLSKSSSKLNEINHSNAIHFKGFVLRIKAILKAVTLSGMFNKMRYFLFWIL